jgi:hypothetical protein
MDNETTSMNMKWYDIRRLRMTREYVGGIIAGFGLGLVILSYLMNSKLIPPYWNIIMVLGFNFMWIGVCMARVAQDRRSLNSKMADEEKASQIREHR